MKGKRPRPIQLLRYGIQTIVAVYVLLIVIANTVGESWAANLHTICPFGGVVNIYTYLADGGYVAKLHSAVFVMLLALLIGLVLTGKSFCGWICPLGSVQQGLGWIGERLWPRAYNKAPRWLERILHYLKWLVLIWVLVQTARSGRLVFQDWDPYYNLYHIWTDEVAITGYVVTGLTLVAALFVPRAFCRFACPLGAFNGIFNSFSFIGIKRDAKTCTDCGRCTKACPVNIDLCAATTIRSVECTRCLKCVDACPQNSIAGDTLKLHTWFSNLGRTRGLEPAGDAAWQAAAGPASAGITTGPSKRRSVSTWLFAGIAVAAFALPILITNLTGDFQITGGRGGGGGGGGRESTEPGSSENGGEREGEGPGNGGSDNGGYGGGAGGSQIIRGSTTLDDIQAMGVDIGELLEALGLPRDTPLDARLGVLAEEYGFSMSEIRAYLDVVP
ncbi:MAG: 4Fe-4S binding protein [Thermoleophilia bacterium]|nr:4Fe-4S binding protein [Thermoleophilia bacterium]